MYMEWTRVVHDKKPLEAIIRNVKRFDGRKMKLSDAARYAVQKLVDEIEANLNNKGLDDRKVEVFDKF